MYAAYLDKLFYFAEKNAVELSKKWIATLKSNPRTTSYKKVRDYKLQTQGESFFKNLSKFYFEQKAYDVLTAYFTKYAEEQYYENIPLEEAVFAIVLLRRQLWVNAESQLVFSTELDQYQSSESINKTVLLTDYAMYSVIKKYGELRK